MRADTLFLILGYIMGNPKAREFILSASNQASKLIEEKYKEIKNALDKDTEENKDVTQILR